MTDDRRARDADPRAGDAGHPGARRLLGVDDLLLEGEVHAAVLAGPARAPPDRGRRRSRTNPAARRGAPPGPWAAGPDGARRSGHGAGIGTRRPWREKNSTLFSVDEAALGFWRIAAADPDRVAVIDADGTRLTSGDLLERSRAIARGLHALGLRPGDAIATVLPNHRAFLECLLAATESGLYLVPVNSHLAPAEAAYVVADSEAKVLVGHEDLADLCRAAAAEADLATDRCFAVGTVDGFRPFSVLDEWPPDPAPDRRPGVVMMYTSGTTGRPKGVRRSLPEGDPDDVAALAAAATCQGFGITAGAGVHLVLRSDVPRGTVRRSVDRAPRRPHHRRHAIVDARGVPRPRRAPPRDQHADGADDVHPPPRAAPRDPRGGRRVVGGEHLPHRRAVPGGGEDRDDGVVRTSRVRDVRRHRGRGHDRHAAPMAPEARHRRAPDRRRGREDPRRRRQRVRAERARRDLRRVDAHRRPPSTSRTRRSPRRSGAATS